MNMLECCDTGDIRDNSQPKKRRGRPKKDLLRNS